MAVLRLNGEREFAKIRWKLAAARQPGCVRLQMARPAVQRAESRQLRRTSTAPALPPAAEAYSWTSGGRFHTWSSVMGPM